MRVTNIIRNPKEIIDYISTSIDSKLFIDRSVGPKAFVNAFGNSKFSTLEDQNFDSSLRDMILSNFDTNVKDTYDFIQIQRYLPGEYILPHKDNYINKIRLFQLTQSNVDGIVIQEPSGYKFYEDVPGCEIVFNRQAWHWVNPVKNIRYSLVIGFD